MPHPEEDEEDDDYLDYWMNHDFLGGFILVYDSKGTKS